MIQSVLTLIRSNRAAGIPTTTSHQLSVLAQISDPESLFTPPKIIISNEEDTGPIASTSQLVDGTEEKEENRQPPISVLDFAALFEISPHLLVQHHVAAVEKMYALPPPSDDESSSDEEDAAEEEAQPAIEGEKLSSAAAAEGSGGRIRSKSRSGRSKSISTGVGREKYVIDPSATYIPTGHPEIASHPLTGGLGLPSPRSESTLARPGSVSRTTSVADLTASNSMILSPSSALQAQLFPEAVPTPSTVVPAPNPKPTAVPTEIESKEVKNNDTSTEGGTDTEEDNAVPAGGATVVRNGGRSNGKNGGRKLYDVVDTNGLLHDVLG